MFESLALILDISSSSYPDREKINIQVQINLHIGPVGHSHVLKVVVYEKISELLVWQLPHELMQFIL